MERGVLTLDDLKLEVRRSFAKVYSALKARELRTLRQVEALWRLQGPNNLLAVGLGRTKDIHVSYDNEDTLFTEIHNFGLINFDNVSVDNDIFLMEEYTDPRDDHMYSYKCLQDSCHERDSDDSLEISIQHEAVKQVIDCPQCVCYVNISGGDVRKKFCTCPSQETADDSSSNLSDSSSETLKGSVHQQNISNVDREKGIIYVCRTEDKEPTKLSYELIKSLDPTQEWLNMIVRETETEPSHILDVMEHTAIECS